MLMTLMVLMMKMVVLWSWSEKNGIIWEKFPNGGGGLTQTHFSMSIYQIIFGMPK